MPLPPDAVFEAVLIDAAITSRSRYSVRATGLSGGPSQPLRLQLVPLGGAPRWEYRPPQLLLQHDRGRTVLVFVATTQVPSGS